MKILSEKYAQTLFDLVEKSSADDLVQEIKDFTDLIIANNDHHLVDEIISEFSVLWDRRKKEISASVISAHPLSEEAKNLILSFLKERTKSESIRLEENIDKDVLGGVIIRYDDKLLDGSLKNALKSLKSNINK